MRYTGLSLGLARFWSAPWETAMGLAGTTRGHLLLALDEQCFSRVIHGIGGNFS